MASPCSGLASLLFITNLIVDLLKRCPDRPDALLSVKIGQVRLVSSQSFFLLLRTERQKRLACSLRQSLQLLLRERKSFQVKPFREPSKRVADHSCFVNLVLLTFPTHGAR